MESKIEYIESGKSFFDKIKNIFLNVEKAINCWKNKKTVDTSFKSYLKWCWPEEQTESQIKEQNLKQS